MSDRESSSATLLDEEELSAMTDPELLAYEREQLGAQRDPRARRQQLNAVSKYPGGVSKLRQLLARTRTRRSNQGIVVHIVSDDGGLHRLSLAARRRMMEQAGTFPPVPPGFIDWWCLG
jgi:hypothetical protein